MSSPTELHAAPPQQAQATSLLTRLRGLLRRRGAPADAPSPPPRRRSLLRRVGGLTGLRTAFVDFLVIALSVSLIVLLTAEIFKNPIVVHPISVPEEFVRDGYTPEVISNQLIIRIEDIFRRTYSGRRGNDLLAAWRQPDVQLPGAGVSMRTIGTYLRSMLGRRSTEISGEIVRDGTNKYTLLLRVARADSPSAQISMQVDRTSKNMLGDAHEKVVQITDRHLHELYKLTTNSPDRAEAINNILLDSDLHEDAWAHYYEGVLAANKGESAAAIKYFRLALEDDRNIIDSLNDWGVILSEKAAIEKFKTAISIAPSNPLLMVNLAETFIAARDYEAAEKELIMAISADADYLRAQLVYAKLLNMTDRGHEGERKVKSLMQQHPNNHGIWSDWASMQSMLNQWNGAVINYRYAQKLDATNQDVLIGLGVAQAAAGEEDATATFSQAAQLYPRSWRVWQSWGHALRMYMGDNQGAEEKFKEGIVLAPNNVFLLIDLADALAAQGKHDEAISVLRNALNLDEGLPIARNLWGSILHWNGKYAAAVEQFRQAVELAPDDAVIHANLADALRLAVEQYRQAVRLAPDDAVIRADLARAYNDWGNALYANEEYEAAVEQYRQAVELAPDGAVFHANLADGLRLAGRPDEALAAISNALKSDPKNAWAYNAWGNVLYGQGRYAAALEQYRQAVELGPDDAVIRANLAKALWSAGRPKEALAGISDAPKSDPKNDGAFHTWGDMHHEEGK